jgi:hypothetical protein
MYKNLSVLIAEDNIVNPKLYVNRYRSFFKNNEYAAQFKKTSCNAKKILQLIETDKYHIFISDITFGDRDELGGLVSIEDIKRKFPNLYVIGNSSANFGINHTVGPSFDLYTPKDALISDEINSDNWFSITFRAGFRCNTELIIEDDALSMSPNSGRNRGEVKRLIQECLFTSHEFDESFDLSKIKLIPLAKGYSDSRVFQVISKSKTGNFRHIQSVIKISRVEKARQELASFNRFVKWTLPFEWRADILGSAMGETYGAVCYSFVDSHEDDVKFYDLETYIISGNRKKIEYVISKIMDIESRKWYKGNIYTAAPSIAQLYRERYFRKQKQDIRKAQQIFEKEIREILDFVPSAGKIQSKQLEANYNLPIEGVFSRRDTTCQTCIGHGDLHARNILVSDRENGKVVFIDFQHTERCHVFEDFVILESSIRLNYPNGCKDQLKIFHQEDAVNLVKNIQKNDKFQLIQNIRRRALAHFPNEPVSNYIFALLAFSMRLLREEKIPNQGRSNILIAIAACCRYFDHKDAT